MFHTFSYNGETHEMKMGFKLWSDFAAHIPLIRSFSMGANWDRLIHFRMIEYPIYPGEPMRFHFIFDMIVGLLEKIGFRIDWALNIPSIIGFTSLLIAIYLLAHKLFHSKTAAILSVIFFLFNGSLSFLEFFKNHTPIDIIHATEFPAFAPWGPGDITAFWNLNIYTNQRHLAGAFAIILLFIFTCLHIEHQPMRKQIRWAFIWAILMSLLPYYHQPALLIVAICLMIYFLLFPGMRFFLFATGVWSSLLIIPQLLLVKNSTSQFGWYPGYIIHNDIINLPLYEQVVRMGIFWWNNVGLHSVLILIGFFLIPKQARKIMLPIIPIFLVGNLLKFSVEVSANHKFFNFVLILGQMISAYVIVRLSQIRLPARHRFLPAMRGHAWQAGAQAIAGGFVYSFISLFLILLTLSGVIDFFVVKNDVIGSTRDIQSNEIAQWIAQNTPRDAVFLNTQFMYDPASMAGRAIFLGWPYFAWSAGYDTIERSNIMEKIHTNPDPVLFCPLLKKFQISHVFIRDTADDPNLPKIDVDYFSSHFTPIFKTNTKDNMLYIFTTDTLCPT